MGINPQQVDRQKLLNEVIPTAVFNVASRLLLDRLADEFNVEVTQEEIEQEIENLAKAYNVAPEELKKSLQEQGLIEVVKADLRRNKALKEAAKRVKFVEVEPKEEKEEGKGETKEGENS